MSLDSNNFSKRFIKESLLSRGMYQSDGTLTHMHFRIMKALARVNACFLKEEKAVDFTERINLSYEKMTYSQDNLNYILGDSKKIYVKENTSHNLENILNEYLKPEKHFEKSEYNPDYQLLKNLTIYNNNYEFSKEFENNSEYKPKKSFEEIIQSNYYMGNSLGDETADKWEMHMELMRQDKVQSRIAPLKQFLDTLINAGDTATLDIVLSAVNTVVDSSPRRIDDLVSLMTTMDAELATKVSDAALSYTGLVERNNSGYFLGNSSTKDFYDTASSLVQSVETEEFSWWIDEVAKLAKAGDFTGAKMLANESINAVEAYRLMGLEFSNLIQDYQTAGSCVLKAKDFMDAFDDIPQANELYQRLIGNGRLASFIDSGIQGNVISILFDKYRNGGTDDYLEAIDELVDVHANLKAHKMQGNIVAHRLKGINRARNLTQLMNSIQHVRSSVEDYVDFSQRQQKKDPQEFSDSNLQSALFLYEDTLGKTYRAFKQDAEKFGLYLQRFPRLRDKLDVFGEEKVKKILNQVIKLNNRDLIDLMETPNDERPYLEELASRLDNSNAAVTVKVLGEFYRTYSFLVNADDKKQIQAAFEGDACKPDLIIKNLQEVREAYYPRVIGSDLDIPESLGQAMDNITVAYFKNTGGINI